MRQILLYLFLCPFLANAQVLNPFFTNYKAPDSQFWLDTSLFESGKFEVSNFRINADSEEELTQSTIYTSIQNHVIRVEQLFPNALEFDYYETVFRYFDNKPMKMSYFRRQRDQEQKESTGEDSLIYDGNRITYIKHITGNSNPGSLREYYYNELNGLQGITITQKEPETGYGGLFHVEEFFKPGKPLRIQRVQESANERRITGHSVYQFDSLGRVVSAMDSTNPFGNQAIAEAKRILIYKESGLKPDSIIYQDLLSNRIQIQTFTYSSKSKIERINWYESTQNQPFKLVQYQIVNQLATGQDERKKLETEISLFPNPTREKVQIQSSEPIEQIVLFSLEGKKLIEQAGRESTTLDLSGIAAGSYLVRIQTKDSQTLKKLIKTAD
ncbi:MAG: T9SS type A sorting domain-containing protein [Bacteroidia bacterium]|nr:T9SS type A sorting domain-containing protein [Bacteroidia bacterium]